ncbi:tripartite tricarboxylate transporter permease [Aestuariivita sp.]|jgi:putative tricarboxylic transport membrane protein|uniref:tripartite tricarboxylate transporter permease n=1 Tax=Aestuariivita sp. TaxID=1872407 RepID=UPI00216F581C|nr:tripartite tricarboxylate transporter permease [Aestuariivita sp.]MCE8006256.1 tripartite tricarboxylate transporter permease [Aestuariivita sp.]
MLDSATILAGLGDAFQPITLFYVLAGVIVGQFVGAVPGIGPVMATAIAIPFTFGMDPLAGIGFLVGVNKGGLVGGAIPAILMNTPGTPDAAATAMDGYPLAKQGKPLKATKMALYSSVTGDTFSDIVLITVSAPLAILALRMGPVEVLGLMLLAFAVIAALMGASIVKGIAAAALGLMAAMVGTDPEHASPRLFFGQFELYDGLPLAAVAIGMLAISELLSRLSQTRAAVRATVQIPANQPPKDRRVSWAEYWACRFTLFRGAVIGTALGALPGIGSTAAAFMSYASAKQVSKDRASFGKGNLHGIAASEAANSSVMGANMIPMLTLGIPGSVSAALIISAFMIHGVQPGPFLFENQGRLIYGLFGAMIIANAMNMLVGQVGMRVWVRVVTAPESFILTSALLLCFVGVSLAAGGVFGIGVMLAFALLGFVMTTFGFSVVIFIIAFFLGPRFEISLSQSLALLNGDPMALINYPFGLAMIVAAPVLAVWLVRRRA